MTGQVVLTEFLKLKRSAVPWVSLGAILAAPWGIALFMWIVRDPQRAADLGLLGTKANLAGLEATWPAFGSYLGLITGAGGMLLVAFIVAYVFGREYADGTAKNLLALPVGRGWFAGGKLLVTLVWWLALAVAALAEGFGIGWLLELPGFSSEVAGRIVTGSLVAAGVSFLLAPVVAWVTVWSRSYLAALGFALGMLLLGDLVGHTGWAPWFPWSIVPLLTGMVGQSVPVLPWTSYLVLGLTFVVGVAGTALQLRLADNP
jgi:ABC-2 type transport system permease protein